MSLYRYFWKKYDRTDEYLKEIAKELIISSEVLSQFYESEEDIESILESIKKDNINSKLLYTVITNKENIRKEDYLETIESLNYLSMKKYLNYFLVKFLIENPSFKDIEKLDINLIFCLNDILAEISNTLNEIPDSIKLAIYFDCEDLIEYIIDNLENYDRIHAILFSYEYYKFDIISKIKNTFDINSLFLISCKFGYFNFVTDFMNLNLSNNRCKCLAICSENGFDNLVKLLLHHGVPADYSNNISLTLACLGGFHKVVKLLLEYGADINTIESLSNTSVMGNVKIMKLFFRYGLNINFKDNVIIKYACKNLNFELTELILKYGAYVDFNFGEPLIEAYKKNDVKIVKLLLDHGADINIRNDLVILLAVTGKNLEMIKLFIEHDIRNFSRIKEISDKYKNIKQYKDVITLISKYE